jgi:phasin family protein
MATTPQEMFDLSKILKTFDPSKMADDMTKMLGQYKLPGLDMDSIVASQKKNVEAVVAANRTVVEGVQSVMKRQAEILQETMSEMSKAFETLTKSGTSPQDLVAAQVDMAKAAFERSLSSMRELAEMVAKSQSDAAAKINERITASLDEIKATVLKNK